MKEKIIWQTVGQFVALCVQLFTFIRDTWQSLKVDAGIVDWLIGPGRNHLRNLLVEIGKSYSVTLSPSCSATIDFSKPPEEMRYHVLRKHVIGPSILLEKRADWLYANGRRLILRRVIPEAFADWRIKMICDERSLGGPCAAVFNVVLRDFFLKNPEFIPDHWPKERGDCILFPYTIYAEAIADDRVSIEDSGTKVPALNLWLTKEKNLWSFTNGGPHLPQPYVLCYE